jgi:hypothetical protein
MLLGHAPSFTGSSAAFLSYPRFCTGGSPKTVVIDGTTACCSQCTLLDYDRSSYLLPGMASYSAATQHTLTNLHEREGVRFLLRSLKQAIESGEVGDIDIGHAVGAERTAATVRLSRKKAVLELVEAGDHDPILGKRGALTGARSAVGMFLQSLLLFHEGDGDDRAAVSGGAGTAMMRRMLLMGPGTAMMRRISLVAAGLKTSRHFALPGREAATRQSRKPLVNWILRFCRTRLWFFLARRHRAGWPYRL